MIEYVDPIPPVRRLLEIMMEEEVYGNKFPDNVALPAVLVKTAGGNGYTRLAVMARANDDITAMKICIRAMNLLERYCSEVRGLRGVWIQRESNPIHGEDAETGKPEAWAYMRMEHIEA